MKELCKICPQFALCAIRPGSNALDPGAFYPQRYGARCTDTEEVFRCFPPCPTKEAARGAYGADASAFGYILRAPKRKRRNGARREKT